jgi:alpha-D-xyloside xylohydrolase
VPSQGEKYFAPSLAPVGLQVKNARGETVLSMNGWEMSPQTVNTEKTYQVGATFAAPADEHYYGMGQNQESVGALDLRGRTSRLPALVRRTGRRNGVRAVHGLVQGLRHRLGQSRRARALSPASMAARRSSRMSGERVSFFVVTGDTPEAIYSGYARLTGKTPIPPKAAFGLIQSKARYDSQESLRVAKTYREKKYPLDVMVVDWFYWTRMGQMDINPAEFPDPGRHEQAAARHGHAVDHLDLAAL